MHLAFVKARDAAGGVQALARIADRTSSNIYALFQHKRPCPAGLVLPIEAATGVSRHELRPDLYPVEG